MIAILLPIKPEWCALEMNGDKTVEVRKENVGKAVQKLIDKYGFADIYVYCTKDNKYGLYDVDDIKVKFGILTHSKFVLPSIYNGKVIFKFRCYKVEEIICRPICGEWESYTKTLGYSEISQASCLKNKEIVHYLKGKNGTAIHINDLEIFDKPKELSEFYKGGDWGCDKAYYGDEAVLTKAPQSWCYVEVEK